MIDGVLQDEELLPFALPKLAFHDRANRPAIILADFDNLEMPEEQTIYHAARDYTKSGSVTEITAESS